MSIFSQRFAELRAEKRVSQPSIAASLGVSKQTVSTYENGREPSFDNLCKLADMFGVTTDYLIGHSEYRMPEDIGVEVNPYDLTYIQVSHIRRSVAILHAQIRKYCAKEVRLDALPLDIAIDVMKVALLKRVTKLDGPIHRKHNYLSLLSVQIAHVIDEEIRSCFEHAWINRAARPQLVARRRVKRIRREGPQAMDAQVVQTPDGDDGSGPAPRG